MFTYIASGKDAHHECSVKVFGETDEEAFRDAKSAIPVVSKLERIEPDGTLTPITGLPYDDLNTVEAEDPEVVRAEKAKVASDHVRKLKILGMFFLAFILLQQCMRLMLPPSAGSDGRMPVPVQPK